MRVAAISGSRHSGGSTEKLLTRCLTRMKERGVEGDLVRLHWKKVLPCLNCHGCRRNVPGGCEIEGDDFGDIYKIMLKADILIMGSPIGPDAACGDFKALLERSQRVARATGFPFFRKVGAPIAVEGKEVSRHALQRLMNWFPAQGMVVPGSVRYPVGKDGSPLGLKYDEAGAAAADDLAANLVWLAEKLKGG